LGAHAAAIMPGFPARHRRSPFVVENAGTNLQGDRGKKLGLAREPFGSEHHAGDHRLMSTLGSLE
jgi:hypothetical protein